MSQAQALLDCVADLIVHCGVLQTVGILQKGVQLEKSASWNAAHHSAEGWRISGTAPSKDGPGAFSTQSAPQIWHVHGVDETCYGASAGLGHLPP